METYQVGGNMITNNIGVEYQASYKNKLKNNLYKLLCEYEEEGEWESFLEAILVELYGFDEDNKTIDWYTLTHKLAASRFLSYKYFRKTIFDCMGLVDRIQVG